ncbi:ADA deaminase, partial [Alcedo cyanopectus]|nr:ADA deaminase [Ceyx cyanopectus]
RKRGVPLPGSTVDDLLKHVSYKTPLTLTQFLEKFNHYMPAIAGDREAVRRIAYELVETKAKEGIIYVEVRYSPHLLANCCVDPIPWGQAEGDLTPDEVVNLVNQGLQDGERDFRIKARSILCCMRHMPSWSPEVVELCKKYQNNSVVAIDLAGDESLKMENSSEHKKAYERNTRNCGAKDPWTTGILEGEAKVSTMCPWTNGLMKRLKHYRGRYAHGWALDISSLLENAPPGELVEKDPEGCAFPDPSAHIPVGIPSDASNYSINTDDPLIFNSSIDKDYSIMKDYMGFTEEDFKTVNINAAQSSFLPEKEKQELLNTLYEAYGMVPNSS